MFISYMDHHGGLEMECYGDLFQCHPEHLVLRGDVLGVLFGEHSRYFS